jgi:hypothetical protein
MAATRTASSTDGATSVAELDHAEARQRARGGREVAADLLRSAYQSGQQTKDQVQRDMRTGKQRAEQQVESRDRNGQTTAGSRGAGSTRA